MNPRPGFTPPNSPRCDGRQFGRPAAATPIAATPIAAPALQRSGPGRPPGGLRTSETADSLTADVLLPGRHKAPSGGWRRAVYQATGGLIRAPQSAAELRRRELTARARTPVSTGHHRVAVMSLKGGVGKTTTTVGLGATLASVRGDRVIAVDANPDRGTLSDKLRLETSATVRDLLNERDQIQRYADVRGFTTQAPSRLEILASDRDPTVSVAFCEEDYYDVAQVLEHYYSISLADCGTGLLHSAMAGVLRLADQIVLVSSPSVDGARSASATLDWLQAHGYGDLVRQAVVVLSVVRPRSKSTVDLDRLEAHFAARSRAVVRIPYDPHLEEGAEVDLAQLNRATADAYLTLAAEVGDGFARPRRPARPGVRPELTPAGRRVLTVSASTSLTARRCWLALVPGISPRPGSQARVYWLRFEGEHSENRFMHAPERFLLHRPFQRFEPERVLPQRQGALVTQVSLPEPAEVLRRRCSRARR